MTTTHTDTAVPTADQIAADAEQTPPMAPGLLPIKTALDYATALCKPGPDATPEDKLAALEAMPFDHRVIYTLAVEGAALARAGADPMQSLARMMGIDPSVLDGNA